MPNKEPMVPLSDVVHLLAGRKKPARKKKRVAKKKAPAPAPFSNRPGYQGFSAFSTAPIRMVPSPYQQFIQPPPQVVKPIQEVERAQTININTNYDPDRHKIEVVSDSKSGVLPIEMNPNDITPRIGSYQLIKPQPSLLSQGRMSLPPVQEPFQPQNPANQLGTNILPIEAIPSAPYDPLRPGGRVPPPHPPLPPPPPLEEKYEDYSPILDVGNLETEEQFDEYYAPSPKRLTKLTRKNPITGELEQYRRGGVLKRAEGGVISDPFAAKEKNLRRNALWQPTPYGNLRDQFRDRFGEFPM